MFYMSWASDQILSLVVSAQTAVATRSSTMLAVPTNLRAIPTPQCQWVNAEKASGVLTQVDYFFGNVLGLIQYNWIYITIAVGIAFFLTLVVMRSHNKPMGKVLIGVFIVAFLLSPALKFMSGLNSSVC